MFLLLLLHVSNCPCLLRVPCPNPWDSVPSTPLTGLSRGPYLVEKGGNWGGGSQGQGLGMKSRKTP